MFPKTSGLYFLTGDNQFEPSLGSNGAGKSTFIDAITWCLYGHTTRGLKANEILSWHVNAGAQVTVYLLVGDDGLKVRRTQKPNGLFLGDKPVDQKELETHLRLNYEAFTHSVLSPQFGTPFFSLKASEKLTLFSDINNLDYWLEKSNEATKLARNQEQELAELAHHMNRAEGQIETIKTDIEDLERQSVGYESERKIRIKGIEKSALELYKQIDKLNGTFEDLQFKKQKTVVKLDNMSYDLAHLEQERDGILDSIEKSSAMKKDLTGLIDEQQSRINNLKALKGSCAHCGQIVKEEYRNTHIAQGLKVVFSFKTDRNYVIERIQGMVQRLAVIKLDVNAALRSVSGFKEEIASIDEDARRTKAKISTVNAQLDNIAARLYEINAEINPYEKLLDDKRNNLLSVEASLTKNRKAFEELEGKHLATSYWSKGFKQIRLFIIEQAFQTLEIEVNNCLAQLGMVDWQVTFDVERENKLGGITKGFIVLIKSPSNPVPVRWENWSGGETQRLQLAGDLGLSNLIMHQAGLENCVEFYDEPSTHLSSQGMLALADMLHERAVTDRKAIWIADHTSISNFGEFEGIITARKTKNGSCITEDGAA